MPGMLPVITWLTPTYTGVTEARTRISSVGFVLSQHTVSSCRPLRVLVPEHSRPVKEIGCEKKAHSQESSKRENFML